MRDFLTLFCAVLLVAGSSSVAQTVRVTAWDFTPSASTGKSEPTLVESTAQQLKVLAPDVVLLRGVSGWKQCSQLIEALKPADYRVVACSAFRDPADSALAHRQVAIIARTPAYFSWSEPWNTPSNAPPPGGFAFAALTIKGHRFGFSCLELPKSPKLADNRATQQWLESLDAYRLWANNRLEGFVAGTFGLDTSDSETSRLIAHAGFLDPLGGKAPPGATKTFAAHLVPSTNSPAGLIFSAWPMTCDFDFQPAPIIVVAESPTTQIPSTPLPQAESAPSLLRSPIAVWCLAGAMAFILFTILVLQIGIRRRLARLQEQSKITPIGPGSYNIAIMPPTPAAQLTDIVPNTPRILPGPQHSKDPETIMRQSLFTHLAEWLKHAFVQRLLRDREQMLAVHQSATTKALAADEHLARIEQKIRQETASYEKQIEQLSRDLLTAREENLELIRTQIKALKSAMADAQSRARESEVA